MANVANKRVTHWVAEAPPISLSSAFLFCLCRGRPSRVLLPQLSDASLHLLRHVHMYTSQHVVILLVSVKQHIIGDVEHRCIITALQCFSTRPLIVS